MSGVIIWISELIVEAMARFIAEFVTQVVTEFLVEVVRDSIAVWMIEGFNALQTAIAALLWGGKR